MTLIKLLIFGGSWSDECVCEREREWERERWIIKKRMTKETKWARVTSKLSNTKQLMDGEIDSIRSTLPLREKNLSSIFLSFFLSFFLLSLHFLLLSLFLSFFLFHSSSFFLHSYFLCNNFYIFITCFLSLFKSLFSLCLFFHSLLLSFFLGYSIYSDIHLSVYLFPSY